MFQQNPLSILSDQLMVESQFFLNSQPEPCWRTRNIVKGQLLCGIKSPVNLMEMNRFENRDVNGDYFIKSMVIAIQI